MTKFLFSLCSSLIVIAACTASKKSTSSSASTTTATTSTTVVTTNTMTETPAILAVSPLFIKPENGIYDPREEELTAIKPQFTDVTLERLKEGYFLYAKGACTKCHEALNIYYIDPFRWGFICDNMAMKAALTPTQKASVYQYVLAIKATKSK